MRTKDLKDGQICLPEIFKRSSNSVYSKWYLELSIGTQLHYNNGTSVYKSKSSEDQECLLVRVK